MNIRKMLDVRNPAPEWLLCDEAGGYLGRRVDVVAFNLWSSRGFKLIGFEIKTDKRDWKNELKNPAKAEESLFKYCDEWFLLTTPHVATLDEIPGPWGWLEQANDRLMTRKKAPKLEPRPITRAVAAALMKRYEALGAVERQRMRDQVYDELKGKMDERAASTILKLQQENAELARRAEKWSNDFAWIDDDTKRRMALLVKRIVDGQGLNFRYARERLDKLAKDLQNLEGFTAAQLADDLVAP